jgi:hypothetical protein
MLLLFCVQVVQINNNESNWKEKKKLSSADNKHIWTCQEKNLKENLKI